MTYEEYLIQLTRAVLLKGRAVVLKSSEIRTIDSKFNQIAYEEFIILTDEYYNALEEYSSIFKMIMDKKVRSDDMAIIINHN